MPTPMRHSCENPPQKQQHGCPPPFNTSNVPSHNLSSAAIALYNEDILQSDCSLKEHDYIGLAEVSSVPSSYEVQKDVGLNMAETDLRLGLGPFIENGSMLDMACESKKNEGLGKERRARIISSMGSVVLLTPSSYGSGAVFHTLDDCNMSAAMTSTQHNQSSKSLDGKPNCQLEGFPFPAAIGSSSKNGSKWMYADTMVDAACESWSACPMSFGMPNSGSMNAIRTACVNVASGGATSTKHFEEELKPPLMYPQSFYWSAPKAPPSWQPQKDLHTNTYNVMPTQKVMSFTTVSGDNAADATLGNTETELSLKKGSLSHQPEVNLHNVRDDAPPAKGQVVGWPPVPSYRRSSLASRLKRDGENGDNQSACFVKVNMEGVPIGRKIDLRSYNSYEALLTALEEMFCSPNSGETLRQGHGAQFLNGSDFVLTHEDKDSDWMLVGDVPWGMFVSTVRRLCISRGRDVNGLGS